jgi:hypothetical protein
MRDPVAETAIAERDAATAATREAVRVMRDQVVSLAIRWISPDDHAAFYATLENVFDASIPAEDAEYDPDEQYEY